MKRCSVVINRHTFCGQKLTDGQCPEHGDAKGLPCVVHRDGKNVIEVKS